MELRVEKLDDREDEPTEDELDEAVVDGIITDSVLDPGELL